MKKVFISMILLILTAIPVYSENSTQEAIENLGFYDKQISAVMEDMALWLGGDREDRDLEKGAAESAVKKLSVLRKEIASNEVPVELENIKELEFEYIDILSGIYTGVYTKDEAEIDKEFEAYYQFTERYFPEFKRAVDEYALRPELPDGHNYMVEVPAMFTDNDHIETYRIALEHIEQARYDDAASMLEQLLATYEGTAAGDCIKMTLSDSYLMVGKDETHARGVQLLGDIVDSGRYSPVLFDAFLRWRTKEQEMKYGMSNWSAIPNTMYNEKRWKLIQVIRGHLEDYPQDNWAVNQVNLLISLPNIGRGGPYGNDNLYWYGRLYLPETVE